MVIAIDFDGTCVTHEYPKIGKDINAVPVLKKIIEAGHKIILFTMRDGKELKEAVNWFNKNKIPLFGVNKNSNQTWTTSPKVMANLYIDDAALGIPVKTDLSISNRPFVDWKSIEFLLKKRDIIKDVLVENFRYNDLVLYCKGWFYKKDSTLLEDLGFIFSKVYGWVPESEHDIAYFMLRALDVYFDEAKIEFNSESFNNCFSGVFQEIKNRCRLSKDVSMDMAIILYVRSYFQRLSKSQIKLNPPHYGKKEHFRLGMLFKNPSISMSYKEMNKIVQKSFSDGN